MHCHPNQNAFVLAHGLLFCKIVQVLGWYPTQWKLITSQRRPENLKRAFWRRIIQPWDAIGHMPYPTMISKCFVYTKLNMCIYHYILLVITYRATFQPVDCHPMRCSSSNLFWTLQSIHVGIAANSPVNTEAAAQETFAARFRTESFTRSSLSCDNLSIVVKISHSTPYDTLWYWIRNGHKHIA